MDDFDVKQMLLDLGQTCKNLADGSVDEGDLVVLDSLREFVEAAMEDKLEDIIDDEKVQMGLAGVGMMMPMIVKLIFKGD